jgi:hypothetical protein
MLNLMRASGTQWADNLARRGKNTDTGAAALSSHAQLAHSYSRCTFRNRPQLNGDNVILPASFPPQTDNAPTPSHLLQLPQEDLDDVGVSAVPISSVD